MKKEIKRISDTKQRYGNGGRERNYKRDSGNKRNVWRKTKEKKSIRQEEKDKAGIRQNNTVGKTRKREMLREERIDESPRRRK